MAEHLPFSEQLKYERTRRGWSQADLASKLGCDTKTVGRWENEGRFPRPEHRQTLCELFGKDAEELGLIESPPIKGNKASPDEISGQPPPSVTEPDMQSSSSFPASTSILPLQKGEISQPTPYKSLREEWGDAPHLDHFYGRTQELATVKHWIDNDRCRIVVVLGMGGVGKTVFTAILAEQVKDAFEYVFWYSLQNAPPLEHLLKACIEFFSNQQRIKLPKGIDDQIRLLIQYLRDRRCLLIFDNLESLFQIGRRVGAYQEGYEGYGRLIQLIGEMQHQSCLVLTSREKPREVARMEGKPFPVRSLYLPGIGQSEGREILKERGLFGSDERWAALINLYSGNPLALQLIAESIRGVFGGDIAHFLQEKQGAFGDIHDLIEQQFQRLSSREREILYWLAIEREAVSLEDISKDLVRPIPKGELLEALDSLLRRSMIVGVQFIALLRAPFQYTLQPVIMEYVTDNLVRRACRELSADGVWTSYALLKAQTKDYVRDSQRRLILAPVAERLLTTLGKEVIEQKFTSMLSQQRQQRSQQRNYLAGNALNLLLHLQCDLRGFDFSDLTIWQAYLQQAALPGVNFTRAQFVESVFNSTFGSILSVVFSPGGDMLAAGTATGEIWIYQAGSGIPLFVCQGHTDGVWSLSFRPDGRVLASSSDDQTIRLWNVDTGQCLKTVEGCTSRVRAVTFSPDGHVLASGSDDSIIRLWDVATGQCLNMLSGHTDRVWSVAFRPDGHTLASGSTDGSIRLWDVATGGYIKLLHGHTDWVRSVVFHPNGRTLASGSDDYTARLWDTESGNCLKTFQDHTNRVWSIAFSPDGNMLASGSEDRAICLWNMEMGQSLKTLQEHMHGVRCVAFSPDGNMLASGGDDQCLRLWKVNTGHCLTTLRGYTNRIWSVDFSPDGQTLVSSSEDHTIRLWNGNTGLCLRTMRKPAHGVRCVAFHPNGNVLASGGEDQTVRLWDGSTGHCLKTFQGHTNWVRCVAFSPDGSAVASGGEDHTIRLWDAHTGFCLQTMRGHTDWVRSVAFSPNGNMLVSGSDDQTLRVWDICTGLCLKVLQGHTNRVRSAVFNPEGDMIASCSEDQAIRFWDVNSSRCIQILQGHTNWVRSVAFSPDGKMLASGSDDQTIRLWNVNTTQCLNVLRGHSSRVRSVVFSPKGVIFASGSDDGTIIVWNIETMARVRTLIGEHPYERMNITGVKGLTEAQKAALRALGAIEMEV